MKRKNLILFAVLLTCLTMAFVETVLRPGYAVKSCIKLLLILGAVFALGGAIFAVILGAFFLCRPFLDLEAIAAGLTGKEGVSRENFLWVALYISIVNSLLEELLFRGLAFLELRRHTSESFAALFSAAAFAAYHIAILDGWFTWWVWGLCMAGLFLGGLIFNALDRRGSLLPSWLAHAGANLAINTIGALMFGLL